jgi:hypothetical protein
MSVITLVASDPNQVPSASSLEVLLGDPSRRMMIFSGIARPQIETDDDDTIYRDEVIVKLGVNVQTIHAAVCQVGLASISNGESAFVLATDTGVLELDPGSSELQLRVKTAVLGEKSALSRFSYQIVAHVSKVAAQISGTIRVQRDIRDLESASPEQLGALFYPTASRMDQITSGSFVVNKLVPLAWGQCGAIRATAAECFVDYVIDGCPFGVPLYVSVDLSADFPSPPCQCGQVSGARPVVLTNVEPEATGIDFAVVRVDVR